MRKFVTHWLKDWIGKNTILKLKKYDVKYKWNVVGCCAMAPKQTRKFNNTKDIYKIYSGSKNMVWAKFIGEFRQLVNKQIDCIACVECLHDNRALWNILCSGLLSYFVTSTASITSFSICRKCSSNVSLAPGECSTSFYVFNQNSRVSVHKLTNLLESSKIFQSTRLKYNK